MKVAPLKNRSLRRAVFTALASLMGTGATAVLFLTAEYTVRWFDLQPPLRPQRLAFATTNTSPPWVGENLPIPATHLRVHLPDPIHAGGVPLSTHPFLYKTYSTPIYLWDAEVGVRPPPSLQVRSTEVLHDQSLAYDVFYTIDAQRRRFTPEPPDPRRRGPLLFMGCSFAFGEGLSDGQTIAAYAAALQSSYHVYNYSFGAWGPNNLLPLVRTADFGQDLPPGRGRAVYIFIPSHLNRVIGSLDLYRASKSWAHFLPWFDLDEQGALVRKGMLDDRLALDSLYGFLSTSQLLTWLNVELPPALMPDHFKLTAKIIAALRDELKTRAGIDDFTVVIYPGRTPVAAALVAFLDEQGIRSLDYSQVDLTTQVDGRTQFDDGHPTAGSNRFLAAQILRDLEIR